MTWVKDIETALGNLGGQAKYSDLYKEIKNVRIEALTPEWKATVRNIVECHCPQSDNFQGTSKFDRIDRGTYRLINENKNDNQSNIKIIKPITRIESKGESDNHYESQLYTGKDSELVEKIKRETEEAIKVSRDYEIKKNEHDIKIHAFINKNYNSDDDWSFWQYLIGFLFSISFILIVSGLMMIGVLIILILSVFLLLNGGKKKDTKSLKEKLLKENIYLPIEPDNYVESTLELREWVLMRDKNQCRICGKIGKSLNAHHIIPRAQGGKDIKENLVTLCYECHEEQEGKGHKGLSRRRISQILSSGKVKESKSRTDHTCNNCFEVINRGEKNYTFTKREFFESSRFCKDCIMNDPPELRELLSIIRK